MTTITATNTYSSKSNAIRAARKVAAQHAGAEVTVWQSAAGWSYRIEVPTPTVSKRGGGRKFMTGVQVRRIRYQPFTSSETVFQVCEVLSKEMDMPVPYRSHVEEVAVRLGINSATARAAYTHFKQVYKLNVKAGRPTAEAEDLFTSIQGKVLGAVN